MKEPCTQSVLMTVQTVSIMTQPGRLCNVILTPAAAASTITVYDNPSAASGTVLAILQAAASGNSAVATFSAGPVLCKTGITAIVSGTGAQAQVYYQLGD